MQAKTIQVHEVSSSRGQSQQRISRKMLMQKMDYFYAPYSSKSKSPLPCLPLKAKEVSPESLKHRQMLMLEEEDELEQPHDYHNIKFDPKDNWNAIASLILSSDKSNLRGVVRQVIREHNLEEKVNQGGIRKALFKVKDIIKHKSQDRTNDVTGRRAGIMQNGDMKILHFKGTKDNTLLDMFDDVEDISAMSTPKAPIKVKSSLSRSPKRRLTLRQKPVKLSKQYSLLLPEGAKMPKSLTAEGFNRQRISNGSLSKLPMQVARSIVKREDVFNVKLSSISTKALTTSNGLNQTSIKSERPTTSTDLPVSWSKPNVYSERAKSFRKESIKGIPCNLVIPLFQKVSDEQAEAVLKLKALQRQLSSRANLQSQSSWGGITTRNGFFQNIRPSTHGLAFV